MAHNNRLLKSRMKIESKDFLRCSVARSLSGKIWQTIFCLRGGCSSDNFEVNVPSFNALIYEVFTSNTDKSVRLSRNSSDSECLNASKKIAKSTFYK